MVSKLFAEGNYFNKVKEAYGTPTTCIILNAIELEAFSLRLEPDKDAHFHL